MSSRAFAYRRAAERRLIYALVIVLAVLVCCRSCGCC